jgi:thiol-disulfide isomerase/thioredoxin
MSPGIFGTESLLRLALAAAIILAGLLLYRGVNLLILARARAHAHVPRQPGSRPAAATLLYFTTPSCAPCKTVQRPAILRLLEQVGEDLQVIEIDAAEQPDVAGQWGVMSVPTTFVLDSSGAPRFVNHGVAPMEKLLRQVENLK